MRPRATLANHPRTELTVASPPLKPLNELEYPRPFVPPARPNEPPNENLPPTARERSIAGIASTTRSSVFQRDCAAGDGRITSTGYSPSSPTNPGYGFATSQR